MWAQKLAAVIRAIQLRAAAADNDAQPRLCCRSPTNWADGEFRIWVHFVSAKHSSLRCLTIVKDLWGHSCRDTGVHGVHWNAPFSSIKHKLVSVLLWRRNLLWKQFSRNNTGLRDRLSSEIQPSKTYFKHQTLISQNFDFIFNINIFLEVIKSLGCNS